MPNFPRTDLASEAHSLWNESAGKKSSLKGVIARKETLEGLSVTAVNICDEKGAASLGKPIGNYFTLELENILLHSRGDYFSAVHCLSMLIGRCFDFSCKGPVLVAALGNPDITPDALGPLAASSILVTRHLKGSGEALFSSLRPTAVCRTGVLGTTGLESALQIKLLCRELKPCCVIAVDALAGADASRLCRSIQICSSGISPGSGVNNSRAELSFDSLGVPVVAIGVPTVTDAPQEGMFVTTRDIDSQVRSAAKLIAYGINLVLHPSLSIEDIEMLVG